MGVGQQAADINLVSPFAGSLQRLIGSGNRWRERKKTGLRHFCFQKFHSLIDKTDTYNFPTHWYPRFEQNHSRLPLIKLVVQYKVIVLKK